MDVTSDSRIFADGSISISSISESSDSTTFLEAGAPLPTPLLLLPNNPLISTGKELGSGLL